MRNFKGITRKSALVELLQVLGENFYDDAGVLEVGQIKIVVSTDGIVEDLVRDDSWLAGFYSVVVNVKNVVARGARPLGYTSSSKCVALQLLFLLENIGRNPLFFPLIFWILESSVSDRLAVF